MTVDLFSDPRNDHDKTAHTEHSVLVALRERHASKSGNGPEWAYVEHVRDNAGFNAKRTLDAMALGLWPSRGMELHGYEVKVSRADFRRELADVAKMDAFAHVLDRFWIVAPKGIVPAEELPATWGLLEVVDGGAIRQKVAAPLLTKTRADIPRDFLVPLMRAAGAGLTVTPEKAAIDEAEERGRLKGVADQKRSGKNWEDLYSRSRGELETARNSLRSIEQALGVNLHGTNRTQEERDARLAAISAAVKAAVNGDEVHTQARQAARSALADLQRIQEQIERTSKWIADKAGLVEVTP
jgi:hypothetical protein